MSFTVEANDHPHRGRFRIKLKGSRKRFYAKDNTEVILALAHYFRGDNTDPRHWGEGIPNCPLCEKKEAQP